MNALTLAEASRIVREAGLPTVWIYFIQVGDDGPIKIGVAKDPADRLKTLQQGNPERLRLRAIYRGFALEETQLHKEHAADRIVGEWFRPTGDLLEFVEAPERAGLGDDGMSEQARKIRSAILGLAGSIAAAADQAQAMTDAELGDCLLTGRWTTIEIHEAGRRLKQAASNDGEDAPARKGTGN